MGTTLSLLIRLKPTKDLKGLEKQEMGAEMQEDPNQYKRRHNDGYGHVVT